MNFFILAGSPVSRGTNFQHHWWTHSLFSLLAFRRSGTKQKQRLDFSRGQTFCFEQLFSSLRNCTLRTSQGSCWIKPGRDFNEVHRGPVTGRVRPLQILTESGWLSSFSEQKPMLRSRLERNLVEGFWDETGVSADNQGISHFEAWRRKTALLAFAW